MSRTYRGILRNDRIEWKGEAPASAGAGVMVQVTVLEQPAPHPEQGKGGAAMAAAMEAAARLDPYRDIEDPVAWQREIREDVPLPGRE